MKRSAIVASTVLSACLATSAYAVPSMDGVGSIFGGDGVSGDMFLAAVAGDKSLSLLWDLSFPAPGAGDPGADLTYGNLTSWAAAKPGGSFTINNATVSGLIDATWDWHVFGVTNKHEPFGGPVVSVGVGTTIDSFAALPTGNTLGQSMQNVTNWVSAENVNVGGLTDNGVRTAIGTNTFFWDNTQGNGQPNNHSALIFGGDVTGDVGDTLAFALLAKVVGPLNAANSSLVTYNEIGSFTFAANGDLTFNAAGGTVVPVPAAVWLFGSAIAGLAGAARRKKS
jgi:hypothetical protein